MSILKAQEESVDQWIKLNTSKQPNTELSVEELYNAYVDSLLKASKGLVVPAPRTFSKFVKLALKRDIAEMQIRYYYNPKSTIRGLSLK